MRTAVMITIGFILDLIIGDPSYGFHPVVIIGKMISLLEKILRRIFPKKSVCEALAGGILAVIITLVSFYSGWGLMYLADKINTYVSFALGCLISYQCIAVRAMLRESRNIYEVIKTGDIHKARKAVGRIVGRDTDGLDMEGVIKADIECVAESLCDGVIAPLFWLMIGGVPLGLAYKAVNTMDSMIGYKNDKYLWFGRAAARLDDIANFIPSRIAALLIMFCHRVLKSCQQNRPSVTKSCQQNRPFDTFHIWMRDRYNHASPNSAQTEAAMAGILGLRLGGPASYFGKKVDKPYIGDDIKSPEAEDIPKANSIFLASSIAGLIVFAGVRVLIYVNL
ncbi:MAG: adenosylcobinamide-phosphate synthase CbiB [Lachnospiraceae bacterium]|nr:adenosylcobinamide-phosphate synthase CbiB [Lachnospiraceae bacterium]